MQSAFTSFPEIVFFLVFITAIGILLYTFGSLIIKEIGKPETNASAYKTAKQVDKYLTDKGYIVCSISPVKNTNQWLAFLVKNGEYHVADVLSIGDEIAVNTY
ncbi:MAG: hypothetical protein K0Q95_2370 [Bacteroidota bacterium]|jgi:hypothetical protein|nr:hypothetical protein [Bacteroidota bacterium]